MARRLARDGACQHRNYASQLQNRTKAFEEMHLSVLEATYQVVVLRWWAGRDRRAGRGAGWDRRAEVVCRAGPPGGGHVPGGTAGVRRGALKVGGTPDGRSRGGVVTAERRRARAERDEAIDDAVTGHIEKLSTIIGGLVEEAGGEQYRCPQCGSFGPKVSDH